MDIRGRGTTMAKQFQFQFQDFTVCVSKFCSLFLSLHSLLHMISLSLIRTNSSSPFASISFHSLFSACVPSHSTFFSPSSLLHAVPNPTSIQRIGSPLPCKEIPSQSPVFHPFLGRRNFIARDWYILHLRDLLCI